jgi:alpha-L-arabinofuranosidase
MIWADNLRAYGTPNYYVQSLFAQNRGDHVLPVTLKTPLAPQGGRIALGTFETSAEFKEVKVLNRDGALLAEFNHPVDWLRQGNTWTFENGAMQQSDPSATTMAGAGDKSWTDYTLQLKARKLGGKEGFLIRVLDDGKSSSLTWNLGGWGNRMHGIQSVVGGQEELITQKPGAIETNRWYELRLEVRDGRLKCYLDNELMEDVVAPTLSIQKVYAGAARDVRAKELILKVVNPGAATRAEINLQGAGNLGSTARMCVLSGADPAGENSLDEPQRIAPVTSELEIGGAWFNHTFAPHSMTVLRIKAK